VRFGCPIYCYDFILDTAGVNADEAEAGMGEEPEIDIEELTEEESPSEMSMDDLNAQLDSAIQKEDYEKASKLRDEINRRRDQQ
jgi:protein-arginine kinase activator protein McsA